MPTNGKHYKDDELNLGYVPRKQFEPFHLRTQRFACLVCHRRAGKTVATINDLQDHALSSTHQRPRYAYIAPFIKQAKSVAWDHARAAAGPLGEDRVEFNENELRIDYHLNGGRLRLFGADNPDALRGLYLDGVVMDECADIDPRLWPEVIRPALSDRRGWAAFIGTPRGHNFFWQIKRQAEGDPEKWFFMTLKASDSGLIPKEELESVRAEMTAEQYAQEYECSFEAAVLGTYYAKLMEEASAAGRITSVPYDPKVPVWTAWDLGFSDCTAIWFAQVVGKEIHVIDYYEASGEPLGHYVRELRDRPYVYAHHLLPHDAEAHELGTGKSRLETLSSLGLYETKLVVRHEIADGINAARLLIPRCWWDKTKCERGIEAMTLR